MRWNSILLKKCALLLSTVVFTLALQGCKLLKSEDKDSDRSVTAHRGLYTFSFPKAGSQLNLDSSYTLLWSPSIAAELGTVQISLYQNDVYKARITSSADNSGSLTINLPNLRVYAGYRIGSGQNYRFRIQNAADTSEWDFSPYFSITSSYFGSFAITSPATGSTVNLDSALSIRWTSTGTLGANVGIHLYKDTTLTNSIVTEVPNSGYYLWPKIASLYGSGENYHLRVFSISDPSLTGLSGKFRIASSYTGKIEFLSPKLNDVFKTDSTTRINWRVNGNVGTTVTLALYRDSIRVQNLNSRISPVSGYTDWKISYGLASGNRYRIKITSDSDPGLFTFSDYFTIKGIEPDSYEGDDSLKLAKDISVDGKPQMRSIHNQDFDYMRFNGALGKRYLVSIQGPFQIQSEVMDSVGKTFQSGTGSKFFVLPKYSGKHFLRIGAYSSYGPYSIAITEYDSTQSPVQVVFATPDAKTTWTAGSTYPITWAADTLFYSSLVKLALYKDSSLISSIVSYLSNSGSYSWQAPLTLVTSDKYRVRISNYSNSEIYSYSPYFTITGAVPDSYEPDQTRLTAKALEPNSVGQSRNLTVGDQDWIRIDATLGKTYLATLNSGYSVIVSVLDSIGTLISNRNGNQITEYIIAKYTGPYFLQIQPYSSGSTSPGNYTVALIQQDGVQDGLPINFTSPDSASTWAAGSSYAINWTPNTALYGSYVYLDLYLDSTFVSSINPSYSTTISNTGLTNWTIPQGMLTSSRYRIRVSNSSNKQIHGYSKRFTISGLSPDAYEPDNRILSAKDIAVDGTVQIHNHTTNDSDWVRFDGVVGKTYVISYRASYTLYGTITDSLGTILLPHSNGSSYSPLVWKPTKNGRYYVRMLSGGGAGSYTLSVLGVDGGPNGIAIKFTSPPPATIWAAGGIYSASWTADTLLFGRYGTLKLYRDTTFVQTVASSLPTLGISTVTLLGGLVTADNYRFRITSESNPQIFGSSEPFSISGIIPDANEPNDSATTAKAVIPNGGKQNLTLSYLDRDWFKFTCKAQMLYLIQVSSATRLYTSMNLYPGIGKTTIATSAKVTNDTLSSITWVCPEDGLQSVSVEPYSGTLTSYGNYGFEIKEIDPASYKFKITSPAENAFLKFNVAQSILWTDPVGIKGSVDIFLYNSQGIPQTIVAGITNTGTYYWTVPASVAQGIGYYLRVISRTNASINGQSGAFSIGP